MTYAHRKNLPDTRQSLTHKVEITGTDGQTYDVYLTVGLFEDGSPGELFITVGKVGSTMRGLLDTIGKQTSLLLQFGVPLRTVCDKLSYLQFEPAGHTSNKLESLSRCSSIVDYVFRWIAEVFEDQLDIGLEDASTLEEGDTKHG